MRNLGWSTYNLRGCTNEQRIEHLKYWDLKWKCSNCNFYIRRGKVKRWNMQKPYERRKYNI